MEPAFETVLHSCYFIFVDFALLFCGVVWHRNVFIKSKAAALSVSCVYNDIFFLKNHQLYFIVCVCVGRRGIRN